MKKGVIYKIINPTGRVYIGKTINFKTRMNYYKNSKSDSQKIISNSIKKYGWENHIVEILECDYNLLNELEIKYIEKEKSFRGINIFGMNLTLGGDGCFGRIDNEEIRKKRGDKHIGTKRTEETKKLMSDIKKGKIPKSSYLPRTEKQLQQLKYGNIGKNRTELSLLNERNTKLKNFLEKHESILQYDLNFSIIKEWCNILPHDIAIIMKFTPSNFYKVLKNKEKTCGGYIIGDIRNK